jgi:hypothetical protein
MSRAATATPTSVPEAKIVTAASPPSAASSS